MYGGLFRFVGEMGFFSRLGIIGFGIGIPLGLVMGFFLFIFSKPDKVKDPMIRPICELDSDALEELIPEIPLWVKHPDFNRVDWFNKFLAAMWPYLDKAICRRIRAMTKPIFAKYIGTFRIQSIEFESLSLGTLSPKLYGFKVHETDENELVMETAIRWAGNPDVVLVLRLFSLQIRIQLIDLQIFAAPQIVLKPLVPAFPCFSNIVVSLLEKPHVDFGLKILGGDIMSIPGLHQFVQEAIRKQVLNLYLWPRVFEIPILDASVGATKKPVGILHVNVVKALGLSKMDLLGTSDPYVKLSLIGERLPSKKTTIKMNNLNPVWNEKFKLVVKDPESQVLHLRVYDWDKVGGHDRLGMQLVPLKVLAPHETKELTLDLIKNTDINNHQNKKPRGQLVVELTFIPFRVESSKSSSRLDGSRSMVSQNERDIHDDFIGGGAGLLWVKIQGATSVEGKRHSDHYAVTHFRGEKKKTKMVKKCRDPVWNEEFPFMLEEPPLKEKIHIELKSRRSGLFSFLSKESLGHVEINLIDVVHNGRINQKYHLINSRHGMIHVEIQWTQ
ncbi:synaptotagmin-3-like isoform X1 [Cucurbita maxima]|uniref:Synaptotagmin-3-like isoform X1 n=2 Tax=Cucurbita maxima TaxID=3661 RepID=A0A6J1JZI4_CUCMA|nr:synaptotagmin-3-like isoform X1 [Cucurbita maxima]XP_022993800.1 synaptotagmin-3-like isoform X1 [Cucurbita maxima]